MTLIELMVVVVILVTLVGGVLPLVSPNNDARKIAEASRGLQTYFMQAQAEAARIGRPVGVGFRETVAGSGIALEVFQMTVPKPYFGSSSQSRVGVQILPLQDDPTAPSTYGEYNNRSNPNGNNGTLYDAYKGAPLYAVDSKMATLDNAGKTIVDPLPPKMFRVGDIVVAQGNQFVIVDDERCPEHNQAITLSRFVNPASNEFPYQNKLICIRTEDILMGNDAQPLSVPPTGYSYGIHRQPMADSANRMNSAEAPFQLPSGVAIDLMSTGLEAGEMATIFESIRLTDNTVYPPVDLPYSVGMMFSPNGGIESVWINGRKVNNVSRMFFLLGRGENGAPDADLYTDWGGRGQTQKMSDQDFKDRQSKVNWLNLDSRWLMVNGNDGRLTVSANALVDPRDRPELKPNGIPVGDAFDLASRKLQIEAAHALAHQHSDGGQDIRN